MVFSSLVFLCIFLPIVWLLHSAIRIRKAQNGLLLAASLLFYAYGEPVYVLLMLVSAFYNYGIAVLMEKSGQIMRKALLFLAVLLNIGVLCYFKYTVFFLNSFNTVTHLAIPIPEITMPIGISFFTFQALSYVIDVYRGQVGVQKNYGKLLLYISFFPQLIAGPIVRYKDIAYEIDHRRIDMGQMAFGLRRFIMGLSKKVLIANTMGAAADTIWGAGPANINGFAAWIGAVSYLMQIYFDFSGYSDMAIGLGQMFGFHFQENFLHPYSSASIKEFWRRWHISLSSWFRDYVYIPLGGNRKGKNRTIMNKLIVFFLTGLWHGANWTFIVWGLFHGFFLMLEEYIPQIKKMPKALGILYTLLTVNVGFVIFRADSVADAFIYLSRMFGNFSFENGYMTLALQVLTPEYIFMLIAAILTCAPLPLLMGKVRKNLTVVGAGDIKDNGKNGELPETESGRIYGALRIISFVLAWLLLVWCIIRLSGSSYNPFIYFRF